MSAWLRHAAVTFWGQTLFFMLVAIAARLYILFAAHGMMDGDEAVLGIQAQHILQGERPIYFSGQAYMGSWDAYLAAPLVALMGPSAWPLHIVTMSESLLLVPLLGAVAGRLYGWRARIFAMLLAAVPPHYVAVSELRALGGYVETMAIGSALLLLALMIAQRWQKGRPTLAQWVLFGFLTGLALWIHVLIVYFPVAIAIWLAPLAIAHARQSLHDGARWARRTVVSAFLTGVALAVGAMPAIIYGLSHNWSNLKPVLEHPAWLDQLSPLHGAIAAYLVKGVIPRMVGAQFFWHMRGGPVIVFGLGAIAAIFALAASIWALLRLIPAHSSLTKGNRWRAIQGRMSAHWPELLPILLIVVVVWIFWRSPNLQIALAAKNPNKDAAGRYALPVAIGLTLLLAGFFGAPPSITARISQMLARTKKPMGTVQNMIVPVLLSLLLFAYAVPYVGSDNIDAMQSPTTVGMDFPAQHAEMLTYLETHNIHYAWSDHWMSHLVMYLTNGRVLDCTWAYL
ncbi:MAG TPA: hypothetical protein VGP82_10505, partial [Ktedonobacterales bacterium]|nr:hypothetical protein [Ktedonobacterales bacterium]